jgi:hypothetical protein
MMPVQKTCGHCATPFSVPPRRSETVKFCSIECKTAAKRCAITCAACGKLFEREKHLAKAKYCSNDCFHSVRKGVPLPIRGERLYRDCEVCAVSFRIALSRRETARWCSRACQSKSPAYRQEASNAQRGEKSWRWAGGLYEGKYGYVRVKGQDLASGEFHFEHRRVIELAMLEMEPGHPFLVDIGGRKKLSRKIEVHHIDLDRSNNELSNLLAVTKFAHAQIHHKNRTPDPWECWPYSNVAAAVPLSTTPSKDVPHMEEIQ